MTKRTNPPHVLTLWYKPSQTMQGLIESGRGHGVAVIMSAVFGGIQGARFYLADTSAGLNYSVIGALLGCAGLYLFSFLLRNFGRWFGGHATLKEARIALGNGLLPWTVLFGALVWALSSLEPETVVRFYWIFFGGFVYGYVILLLSLAAALRISAMKTFFCLLVTVLFSLFPLTLLIQVFAPHLIPAQ